MKTERIRVRGVVQGVGFRPTVARVAAAHGLGGYVKNDGEGVVIGLSGESAARDAFLDALLAELPPLARIDEVERHPIDGEFPQGDFRIEDSEGGGGVATEVAADAAMCADCAAEVLDPYARRYRYPFTTCTHCGPRFSIANAVPFDRDATTMARFPLCPACRAEYEDPEDRRFHAQSMACFACGPQVSLRRADGRAFSHERLTMMDAVDAVGTLLLQGEIVAVKGLGSYHLCCDATNPDAVARLRARKRRAEKPLALMARDLDVIDKYAFVSSVERAQLTSPAAPIVLLDRRDEPLGPPPMAAPISGPPPLNRARPTRPLAELVAPGHRTVGFMLPCTPLHLLMLRRVDRPIVCTSGNLSDEPPVTEVEEAQERLQTVADWFLDHDRPIAHRVDDSVVRVTGGQVRTLRRARGLAPSAERLPPGLEAAPALLAAGGQFKSAFALTSGARVILSPHLGDLDHLAAFEAFVSTQDLLRKLYGHEPEVVVVDRHPEYRATQWARDLAASARIPLLEVGHHHAHVAAVMAEHGYPADAPSVLGFSLDGLGLGDDGALWGGELFYGHYARVDRVGTFKPVALLGGDLAAKQPWRNLLSHLLAASSWAEIELSFGDVAIIERLAAKATPAVRSALSAGLQAPLSSSCGRLFDAVAAATGLCFDGIDYEGQAAIELEASIAPEDLEAALAGERYPIGIPTHPELGLPYLEPKGMWAAILGDVFAGETRGRIAARFHVALAEALVRLAELAARRLGGVRTVVLSGGCFVNEVLLTRTVAGFEQAGFRTLTPSRLPAHDGGLALGQAAIAAARLARRGEKPCA